MEVAFDFDIQSEDDVLRLESTIRTILQCEGTVCAFLESLPYRLIRRSLLQRLHKVIGHDADMCAYSHQNISLHVKDARLVTLRTQPISTENTTDTAKAKITKTKKNILDTSRDDYLRLVKAKRST